MWIYCIGTCTALLQIPAEFHRAAEQILHSHSAPCALREYAKKNQLCFVSGGWKRDCEVLLRPTHEVLLRRSCEVLLHC